jgi:hypothetical protein
VLERGEDFGTAVIVVNSSNRMGDPTDMLARGPIRGRTRSRASPGMISEESDGAIVMGAVSPCALVMLSGPDTPMVKRVAGRIEAQD